MSDDPSPDGLNPLPDIEATTDKIDAGLLTAFGLRHPQLTKTDLDFITAESTQTNFQTLQKILLTDTEQSEPFHDKVMKVHDHLNRSGEEAQKLFSSITSPSQRTALQQTRKDHKPHIQKLYAISKNDPDAIPTELSTNHEQLAKNRLHEYTSNQIRTQTTKTFLSTVADSMTSIIEGVNTGAKARIDTSDPKNLKIDEHGNYTCKF